MRPHMVGGMPPGAVRMNTPHPVTGGLRLNIPPQQQMNMGSGKLFISLLYRNEENKFRV